MRECALSLLRPSLVQPFSPDMTLSLHQPYHYCLSLLLVTSMSHLETVGTSPVVPRGLAQASTGLPALTSESSKLREGTKFRVCSLTPFPQTCPESGLHAVTPPLPLPPLTSPPASDTCAGWAAPRFDYETVPWGRERDQGRVKPGDRTWAGRTRASRQFNFSPRPPAESCSSL